jgi:tRNA (guanine-N7-)-methyltransferase
METDKAALRTRHAEVLAERRAAVRDQLARILPPTNARITWEVGSGHGHFLNAYAATHPGKLCIGVDIETNRIVRAEKKRDRAQLTNLHFIHAEARLFLEALPADTRIAETFILFPDPWPKLRHHKHRILQPAFLTRLAAHAADAASLYFRTDHHPYYLEARATLAAASEWQLVENVVWPFEHATVFQARADRHDSLIARKRQL